MKMHGCVSNKVPWLGIQDSGKWVIHYARWNSKKSKEVTGQLARLAYLYGFSDSNEKYDSLSYVVIAWLRPVAGFPLMASTYVRQYG